MSHLCHAIDCPKHVPPRMLMCRQHWSMVPKTLQAAIWEAYVPGQEITKTPSAKYMQVQQQAVQAVAIKERKSATNQLPLDLDTAK